jgi:hypothetical protein
MRGMNNHMVYVPNEFQNALNGKAPVPTFGTDKFDMAGVGPALPDPSNGGIDLREINE